MTRAVVIALFGLLAIPLGSADEDPPPFIPCDDTPGEVVGALLEYPEWFIGQVVAHTDEIAGKAKCTSLKAAMICSEERVAGSPGTPTTTGSAHPHQALCYEYGLTNDDAGRACGLNDKLRHRKEAVGTGYRDIHACVPLDDEVPWPL